MPKPLTPSSCMFLFVLQTSTVLTLTTSNWFLVWMGMELNLIAFTPLLLNKKKSKELEGAIKYFIIQAVASMLMILSIIASNYMDDDITLYAFVISILIKMGAAPFHMWLPQVMNSSSWVNCILILTWQKLAPLCLLTISLPQNEGAWIFISLGNSIVGAVGGLCQTQMRPLLAYSSISHMGWLFAAYVSNTPSIMYIYFTFYSILTFLMIHAVNKMSKTFTSKTAVVNHPTSMESFTLKMSLLALGGMPPLLGFFMKWMVIWAVAPISWLLALILTLSSVVNLYFYLKIVIVYSINSNKKMMSYSYMEGFPLLLFIHASSLMVALIMFTY